MNFFEFCEKLEENKEIAYKKAWFELCRALQGESDKDRIEVAKYIINRKEGLPTHRIAGENGSPLISKVEIEIKK